MPNSLRDFINFSYITFEDLKTNILTYGKIKPKSYPKTKDYIKPIETIEKKKQTVLEPIMNDLEYKEITPPVEKVEIKDSKPRLFSFSKAKLALIIGVLCLILGIMLEEQTQLGLWIRYFLLNAENFVLSFFIKQ